MPWFAVRTGSKGGPRGHGLGAQQALVLFRSVDGGGHAFVSDGNIQHVLLVLVLNLARRGGRGRAQELLHQVAADEDGVAVHGLPVARYFWHDCPYFGASAEESFPEC